MRALGALRGREGGGTSHHPYRHPRCRPRFRRRLSARCKMRSGLARESPATTEVSRRPPPSPAPPPPALSAAAAVAEPIGRFLDRAACPWSPLLSPQSPSCWRAACPPRCFHPRVRPAGVLRARRAAAACAVALAAAPRRHGYRSVRQAEPRVAAEVGGRKQHGLVLFFSVPQMREAGGERGHTSCWRCCRRERAARCR